MKKKYSGKRMWLLSIGKWTMVPFYNNFFINYGDIIHHLKFEPYFKLGHIFTHVGRVCLT